MDCEAKEKKEKKGNRAESIFSSMNESLGINFEFPHISIKPLIIKHTQSTQWDTGTNTCGLAMQKLLPLKEDNPKLTLNSYA